MEEAKYEIVKELPKITHKYALGQEVMIIHQARAMMAKITAIKIDLDEHGKQVIYVFGEINGRYSSDQVGRKENDVWEHKQDLINAIFGGI